VTSRRTASLVVLLLAVTGTGCGGTSAAAACVLENDQVASAPEDFLGDVGSTISLEITEQQEADDGQAHTCSYLGALTPTGMPLAVHITTYRDAEVPERIFEAVGEPQGGYDFEHDGTHIRTSDDRAVANVHGTWFHVQWSYQGASPDLFAARVLQQVHETTG
jgi:hypothetical protein